MNENNVIKEGKVIEIIDDNHLIINLGKEDGIEEGYLAVVKVYQKEVRDPLSNKIIETIPGPKYRLKIIEVHNHISLCKGVLKKKKRYNFYKNLLEGMKLINLRSYPDDFTDVLEKLNKDGIITEEYTKLPINERKATHDWPSMKKVSVGDPVEVVINKDNQKEQEAFATE